MQLRMYSAVGGSTESMQTENRVPLSPELSKDITDLANGIRELYNLKTGESIGRDIELDGARYNMKMTSVVNTLATGEDALQIQIVVSDIGTENMTSNYTYYVNHDSPGDSYVVDQFSIFTDGQGSSNNNMYDALLPFHPGMQDFSPKED